MSCVSLSGAPMYRHLPPTVANPWDSGRLTAERMTDVCGNFCFAHSAKSL